MDENKKFYVAVIAFLTIIFTLSYFVIQSGQQDEYTILYFSNPVEPLIYSDSEKKVSINFTIENRENMDLKYAYTILVNESEALRKDIALKDGETVVILEDATVDEIVEGLNVSVQLYKEDFEEVYRQIWSEIN